MGRPTILAIVAVAVVLVVAAFNWRLLIRHFMPQTATRIDAHRADRLAVLIIARFGRENVLDSLAPHWSHFTFSHTPDGPRSDVTIPARQVGFSQLPPFVWHVYELRFLFLSDAPYQLTTDGQRLTSARRAELEVQYVVNVILRELILVSRTGSQP